MMDNHNLQHLDMRTKLDTSFHTCDVMMVSKYIVSQSNSQLVYIDKLMVGLFDLTTYKLISKIETSSFDENGIFINIKFIMNDDSLIV